MPKQHVLHTWEILLTYFPFWHVKHAMNIIKVMEKGNLYCRSLWDFFFFFFGLKDLFPWWWYSVLSIGINISGEDLGGVIVLSAIFVTPRMQNSPGWKSGYYSRHAKFNHLGSEEVMLKHRKKARESNLVLPNSNQEVLIVVMFYNCWMIRDKQ